MIHIRKGLDLPLKGAPEQKIYEASPVKKVAIIGPDYNGMKPTMLVQEGDKVKIGQPLFECKKTLGVSYTAPAAGTIKSINRGEKRVFQNIIIDVADKEESIDFGSQDIGALTSGKLKDLLVKSGQWICFRTRPYSKVPSPESTPHAIFINAMDTNPLSANPSIIISQRSEDFDLGLKALVKLHDCPKYLCQRKGDQITSFNDSKLSIHEFEGIHPAGNVGTHMHFVDPAGPTVMNWHLDYQDVMAIGYLLRTGRICTEKIISLAGPQVKSPRLLKTRLGACLEELTKDQLTQKENRIISGSALHGRRVKENFCFLGRYHNQITVLEEGREREFLGWHAPGFNKFSVKSIFLSKFTPNKKFEMTTTTHGSLRAMVPIGSYEKIMPLDILPTQLLRALCSKDTDLAQKLGCLELDEEDLALCTFVDPGKVDYGPILRENLNIIEKEG